MSDIDRRIRRYQEQALDVVGSALANLGATLFGAGQKAQASAQAMARGLDTKAQRGVEREPPETTGRGLQRGDYRLSSGTWDAYEREIDRPSTRRACYHDFTQMDRECPEVAAALDAIARNVCTSEDGNETTFTVTAEDKNLQRIIDALNERTRLPEYAASHVRAVKKLGDLFLEVVCDSGGLIWDTVPLPASSMERIESDSGRLQQFFQMSSTTWEPLAQWDPWEILHIRNAPEAGGKYGRGQMLAARKAWKQTSMLEDGTVIMVLERAPMRYVHKFLVPDDESLKNKAISDYKLANLRRPSWDSSRDSLQSAYDALDQGDVIIPVNAADIEGHPELMNNIGITSLEGQRNIPEVISANEYFQRKLIIATQVPPAYIGIEKEVRNRSMLSHQELEFGRMLRQTQSVFSTAYKRGVYGLQFRLLGMSVPADAYSIHFPTPSNTDEKIRAETMKLYAEAAAVLGKQFNLPLDAFLRYFLDWDDEDATELAADLGAPTAESTDLAPSKEKRMFADLDDQAIDPSAARYLADVLERIDENGRYLRDHRS